MHPHHSPLVTSAVTANRPLLRLSLPQEQPSRAGPLSLAAWANQEGTRWKGVWSKGKKETIASTFAVDNRPEESQVGPAGAAEFL